MVWELINTPPFLVLFIFSFSRLFFLMLHIFRPSVEPGELGGTCPHYSSCYATESHGDFCKSWSSCLKCHSYYIMPQWPMSQKSLYHSTKICHSPRQFIQMSEAYLPTCRCSWGCLQVKRVRMPIIAKLMCRDWVLKGTLTVINAVCVKCKYARWLEIRKSVQIFDMFLLSIRILSI